MKLRMDFVTNSSCSAEVEIVIDNPVLLEILARYKEMGFIFDGFSDEDYIESSIGSYLKFESTEGDLEYAGEFVADPTIHTLQPAVHIIMGGHARLSPTTLDEVLIGLIDIIDWSHWCYETIPDELLESFKNEIKENLEKINQAYTAVYWHLEEEYEGDKIFRRSHYEYDKTHGESKDFEQEGYNSQFDNF